MTLALPPDTWVSIAAVERDTGVSKDTLRVWERRYGFPQPQRDARGDRIYPRAQLEKLRLVKRLIDSGQRPGQLLALDGAELLKLVRPGIGRQRKRRRLATFSEEKRGLLMADLDCLQQHALDSLRARLRLACQRDGVARFAIERVEPLNQVVGDAVTRGQLPACAEWAYVECVQRVLIEGLSVGLAPADTPLPAGPRVLLASFAHQPANAGLIAAEAVLTAERCCCRALGGQAPLVDIAQATQAYGCEVLVLAFGRATGPHEISRGLRQLQELLAPGVAVWVLGVPRAALRRLGAPLHELPGLAALAPALAAWRATTSTLPPRPAAA